MAEAEDDTELFEHEEMLEGMNMNEIDALGWTQDQLKQCYEGGKLAHLGEPELETLFERSWQRDMQATFLR